jgi:tight adherence protein B
MLQQAGWPIRLSEFNLLRLFCAILFFVFGVVLVKIIGLGPVGVNLVVIGLFGLFGLSVPMRIAKGKRAKRLAEVDAQLPEFLTSMAKSLRVGAGLLQALGYASDETPEPLGSEIGKTLRDLQLGGDPEVVFEDLRQRVGSPDLDIAVTAMMIQRTVGGNLSEILTNVANTIRERHEIRSEVNVLTSRQRLTGNLVAALPVLLAIFYLGANPDVGKLLFTTLAGNIALAVGLFFEVLGLWIIRRLAIIEY